MSGRDRLYKHAHSVFTSSIPRPPTSSSSATVRSSGPVRASAAVHRMGGAAMVPMESLGIKPGKKRGRPKQVPQEPEKADKGVNVFDDKEGEVDGNAKKKIKEKHEAESKQYLKRTMAGTLVNMYQVWENKDEKEQPASIKAMHLKVPMQVVICGKTGAGKTNLLMNIYKSGNCWDRVYIFAKDKEEHLYKSFVEELKKEGQILGKEIVKVFTSLKDFPSITNLNKVLRDKKERMMLIVDDQINESAKSLKDVLDAYILGRKGDISPFFLTQSFFRAPIVIRENTSLICLGRLAGEQDMKRIVKEFPQLLLNAEQITELYKKIQLQYGDMNFLTVDTSANELGLQFRLNLAPYSIFPPNHNSNQ